MLQDIAPHVYDNAFCIDPPEADSYALYYEEHTTLIRRNGESIDFPRFRDLENLNDDIYDTYTYLFSIDGQRFYLVENINREPLSDFAMENTQIFRMAEPQYLAFAGITGYQLYNWYQCRHFCGRCGSVMQKGSDERMLFCEQCRQIEYPKLSPAVIIAVTDGNRLLLSKYAGRAYARHALLAGFVEIGETIEDTVRREVMEEVGLHVKNIRYYASQPWSFSDTVLMGFYCELDGSDQITLDERELSLAEWFHRDEIPVTPLRDSMTNEMIMMFKNKR